ncbi:ABC transporter permease, partial [uncultured Amaricoccus sp.]|uniref:ABC transporter permease n=1 Tax=uncultured Amaricoccus sp. TaxID=339341 RepID=UPI002607AC91
MPPIPTVSGTSSLAARPVPLQRLRVLFALILRDMNAKFGRSVGGYLWAVAEPLGGIVLLAVAFSLALRMPPIGTSFLFFYATGMIPFTLYGNVAASAANAVRSNRGLLSYSVVTPLDAVLAGALLELMTMSVVAALLFTGIVIVDDVVVNFEPIRVVRSFAMAAVLGLGVGTLNCVLFGFFPTWKNIWGVLNKPLFLISGVFFTFNSAPPAFQEVLWYNPLSQIIGEMRAGFYGAYRADYVSDLYVFGIGLSLFVIG